MNSKNFFTLLTNVHNNDFVSKMESEIYLNETAAAINFAHFKNTTSKTIFRCSMNVKVHQKSVSVSGSSRRRLEMDVRCGLGSAFCH